MIVVCAYFCVGFISNVKYINLLNMMRNNLLSSISCLVYYIIICTLILKFYKKMHEFL